MNKKNELPFVSVFIPVLNEENYIKGCIESIILQDYPKDKLEVILIDGKSWDNTRKIILEYTKKFNFIKLLENKKHATQFGLNLGIENSKGEYVVRMDAHTNYAIDYITKSIEFIQKTGAQNVGGPMIAEGKTRMQKIVAAAYHSAFVLGGGKNHDENYEGSTDTVAWGTFKKKYITFLGMYDENLFSSEDDDLSYRIIESGGKIFITPKIKSIYYPRANIKSLFKQYFKYGLWKVAVIKKHKKPARITHLVPLLFVIFLFIFVISIFCSRIIAIFQFVIICFYLLLNVYFSFHNKRISVFFDKLILVLVSFIIHFSYGLGFLIGIFKFFGKKFNNDIPILKFSKEKLRDLQLKSLELLLKFQKFCAKKKLTFFLCGGCCIGAIRNKSFIPWDDDIDVFMPRNDYEKLHKFLDENNFNFVKTAESFFPKNIFTKIINKNNVLIKKEQLSTKTQLGICIDVFPLDGCPDNFFARKFQIFNALIYSLYITQIVPENHGKLVKFISIILLKIVPNNNLKYKIAKFCEKNMLKYEINDCKFVTELCAGPVYMKNKYHKDIFKSAILKEFEGYLLPVPIKYDEYLKIAFGDYMKLPPEKDRIPTHNIIF
ncbi:MAG: LicD family protein [Oscillospiraceae bacterium]|nr:LicD family protein [Oscillospiraceae bacterium]